MSTLSARSEGDGRLPFRHGTCFAQLRTCPSRLSLWERPAAGRVRVPRNRWKTLGHPHPSPLPEGEGDMSSSPLPEGEGESGNKRGAEQDWDRLRATRAPGAGVADQRSQDGGAPSASSERRAGCPERTSGDGARVARSRIGPMDDRSSRRRPHLMNTQAPRRTGLGQASGYPCPGAGVADERRHGWPSGGAPASAVSIEQRIQTHSVSIGQRFRLPTALPRSC